MKNITLTFMTLLLSLGLMAQDQGTILLSGSTGLNFSSLTLNDTEPNDLASGEEYSSSTLDLNLTMGYFVTDGLAVGLAVSSEADTYKSEYEGGSSENKISTTLIAPMVRYYVSETGLYGQLSYGFGSSINKSTSGSNSNETETKVSNLGIGLGYSIFLSDDVALSPSLTYSMLKSTEEEGAYDDAGKAVDYVEKWGGISFGLGVTVFLGN